MAMEPLVSVVITAYNQGWCIHEAIESALQQTYPSYEVIVVDDASTDGTAARLASFGARIRSFRHASNQGRTSPAAARNTGIRAARGSFISILDGDDRWDPEHLAVQVDAAQRHPTSGLIAVDGIRFHHHTGATINPTLFVDLDLTDGAEWTGNLYERLLRACLIETPSQILIRRTVFDTVGLFHDVDAEDYEFLLRVAERYPITLVRRKLTHWRYQPSSRSGPFDLQQFCWIPRVIDARTRHAINAGQRYRSLIQQQNRWDLSRIAYDAFVRGRQGEQRWATRYLIRLIGHMPPSAVSWSILLYILRLWCPKWLITTLRPIQRLLRHRPATT
jgi:glycosyltransferase involved in cell wall biosynthesis